MPTHSQLLLDDLANESFNYATSYLKIVKASLEASKRRFDNDMLYNLIAVCFEKFMMTLLAHHDLTPNSHLPLLLYKEAKVHEPSLGESIKQTALLIGSFEAICSFEDFGYKTPNDSEIRQMLTGLGELQSFVTERMIERIA